MDEGQLAGVDELHLAKTKTITQTSCPDPDFCFLFLAGWLSVPRHGPHRGVVVPVHGHLQQVVQVVLQLFLEERKREEEEGGGHEEKREEE